MHAVTDYKYPDGLNVNTVEWCITDPRSGYSLERPSWVIASLICPNQTDRWGGLPRRDKSQVLQAVVIIVPIFTLAVAIFSAVITFMSFRRGPSRALVAVGGLVYTVSPFDLIPEIVVPFFGYCDDLTLLILVARYVFSRKVGRVTRRTRELLAQ